MDQKNIENLEKALKKFNCIKNKITLKINKENTKETYKEYSFLEKISKLYTEYKDIIKKINETKILLENADEEIKILAKDEIMLLNEKEIKCEKEIKKMMLPKKENEINSVFLEIRAAAGGDESAIFVEDLFKMYLSFSERINLKYNIMSFSNGNSGGYKEIIIRIEGLNAFERFKKESGIHRVQRVPKTDTKGRIHTSTCSVVILQEIKSIENIKIDLNDLRIDTYRSSGAGGQHVNVTDSAVRITHIQTGLVAECQSERSQHKNKQRAMSLLMSRLLSREKAIQKETLDNQRKKMVGKGLRSEKIRTYNYTENRITDHRINLTIYKLSEIMQGNLNLIINKLNEEE